MHKKQYDHDRLEAGNPECHNGAENTHVDKGRTRRYRRHYQQKDQDKQVGLGSNDVMLVLNGSRHDCSPLPITSEDDG
jgi:hypothetical protein